MNRYSDYDPQAINSAPRRAPATQPLAPPQGRLELLSTAQLEALVHQASAQAANQQLVNSARLILATRGVILQKVKAPAQSKPEPSPTLPVPRLLEVSVIERAKTKTYGDLEQNAPQGHRLRRTPEGLTGMCSFASSLFEMNFYRELEAVGLADRPGIKCLQRSSTRMGGSQSHVFVTVDFGEQANQYLVDLTLAQFFSPTASDEITRQQSDAGARLQAADPRLAAELLKTGYTQLNAQTAAAYMQGMGRNADDPASKAMLLDDKTAGYHQYNEYEPWDMDEAAYAALPMGQKATQLEQTWKDGLVSYRQEASTEGLDPQKYERLRQQGGQQ